ncbi:hypothetical protein AT251_03675 [Enterovibrio nigricans]|nr:GyrI-like domain-containing protein [Enterovibrio nigricans]PKF51479.1 hypothetical protein AT251_03675 [Enterovibrio nigricans]
MDNLDVVAQGAKGCPRRYSAFGSLHDSPVFTPAEKCRYEAALSLPATLDIAIEPPFQKATLPGGRYAAFRFKGSPEQMEGFQTRLFTDWLPFSGFEPDAAPIIEFYDKPHPDTNDETTQLVLDVLVLLKVKSLKWG